MIKVTTVVLNQTISLRWSRYRGRSGLLSKLKYFHDNLMF